MNFFPFEEIRLVQAELIKDIEDAVKNNKSILIHAPTGIGKTAAAISAILDYAIKNEKTIFFLTNRHTQHKIAIETLNKIKEKHKLNFRITDLIGKKWMCLLPGATQLSSGEFAEYCRDMIEKRSCDFFNNLKAKSKLSANTKKALEEIKSGNIEEIKEVCFNNKICPYETACVIAKESRVIIADYFHVLNPSIRESLFKRADKSLEKSIIILDEAHNLSNRVRELLTSIVSTFILDNSIKEARSLNYNEIADDIVSLKRILEEFTNRLSIEVSEILINKDEFVKKVKDVIDYDEFIGNLKFIGEQALEEKKRSFSKAIAAFLEAWLGPDKGFARILTKGFDRRGKPFISLAYRCLDPSLIMKPLSEAAVLIGMSGTLMPLDMYRDLFGINAELKRYPNPFPKDNRLNLIVPKTTTKFTKRDPEMYKKIAAITAVLVNSVPGNSIVYFPSYSIRDSIQVYFNRLCEKTIFLEQPGLTKEEKEELIERFKDYNKVGAVVLGASAGSLGEGIDLPGDFLKAVIVVGIPLEKPDLETKELIKYYDERFKKGWDYGYIYPAVLKTLQNAGRCIRSKTDRGVIVFLDERYAWGNYTKCFPEDLEMIVTNKPVEKIREFFGNKIK